MQEKFMNVRALLAAFLLAGAIIAPRVLAQTQAASGPHAVSDSTRCAVARQEKLKPRVMLGLAAAIGGAASIDTARPCTG
jgi:hypothetical protein